jgi:YfiH family protein
MATGFTTASLPAPFTFAGHQIAVDLGHGARALFTTRHGGVSPAPFASLNLGRWSADAPANVQANRERVAQLVGVGLHHFAQGRQVHGTEVLRVDGGTRGTPDADGVATGQSGVAVMVLTADCLPIALATPTAVAMVHAGWRGLAGGVVEAGVRAVRELGGDDGPLSAAIGPGAGGCCYEVGDDVREALGAEPCGAPAPIDLKRLARARLAALGADVVHDVGLCTMCTDPSLFFSHRRDGPVTGRQGGVAWRPSW